MQVSQRILYLYAESAIHAGTGTGLGAVDLPIQRERHTDYPIIQASGVKGALRAAIPQGSDEFLEVFGGTPGNDSDNDHASAISPGDARILLFPVRALKGVFVWVTCPAVLERYQKDTGLDPKDSPIPAQDSFTRDEVLVSSPELIIENSGRVMLDEYAYSASYNETVAQWAAYFAGTLPPDYAAWQKRLASHLILVHDDDFRDFVKYATEIVTRIHIDNVTKTVKDGQLFTQELLPADCVLYSLVQVTGARKEPDKALLPMAADVDNWLANNLPGRTQIGADETVGRGRVRLIW